MQKFPKFPEIFSGGVKNHQKWCFSSVNSSVHRVCPEGPFWTPGVQKWTLFWVFFWPCKTCLIRVKTLILVLKKTPGYKNLQKFANFDKIFDNFWQFFANFFFKKNKKLKKIYYKLFFFGTTSGKIKVKFVRIFCWHTDMYKIKMDPKNCQKFVKFAHFCHTMCTPMFTLEKHSFFV